MHDSDTLPEVVQTAAHLGLEDGGEVGAEVVADALRRAGQCDTPYQQNQQDSVREECREPDHLHINNMLDWPLTEATYDHRAQEYSISPYTYRGTEKVRTHFIKSYLNNH